MEGYKGLKGDWFLIWSVLHDSPTVGVENQHERIVNLVGSS